MSGGCLIVILLFITLNILQFPSTVNLLSYNGTTLSNQTLFNHNNNNNNTVNENHTNNSMTPIKTKAKKHSLNDLDTLAFYFITIALTILCYALVLPSAYKKKRPSSVFIFSLAFADFFIGLIVVPIKVSEVYGADWQNEIVWCRIVNAVTIFGVALAGTNVVAVSIDRAVFFMYPLRYQDLMTVKRAFLICLTAFIFSVPALLPAIGIGGQHHEERLKFCAFKYSLTRSYMWATSMFYFFFTIAMTVLLQLKIMMMVNRYYKEHRNFVQENNPQEERRRKQIQLSMKRELRVQRMFAFIILFFILCWGPFVVGMLCNLVALHLITPFFIQLMRIMLFINSFVNPLIMYTSSDGFAELLQKIRCNICNKSRKRSTTLREVEETQNTSSSSQAYVTSFSSINQSYEKDAM